MRRHNSGTGQTNPPPSSALVKAEALCNQTPECEFGRREAVGGLDKQAQMRRFPVHCCTRPGRTSRVCHADVPRSDPWIP
jgi:hypothetical protein